MAAERIAVRMKAAGSTRREKELTALLIAAQDDLATLKAKLNAVCAKLDLDAGVTDANYASLCGVGTLNLQS